MEVWWRVVGDVGDDFDGKLVSRFAIRDSPSFVGSWVRCWFLAFKICKVAHLQIEDFKISKVSKSRNLVQHLLMVQQNCAEKSVYGARTHCVLNLNFILCIEVFLLLPFATFATFATFACAHFFTFLFFYFRNFCNFDADDCLPSFARHLDCSKVLGARRTLPIPTDTVLPRLKYIHSVLSVHMLHLYALYADTTVYPGYIFHGVLGTVRTGIEQRRVSPCFDDCGTVWATAGVYIHN